MVLEHTKHHTLATPLSLHACIIVHIIYHFNASPVQTSCCVSTSLEFTEVVNGRPIAIPGLPEDCMLPPACAGGMAVFAMPVAILTALIAALAVIF